MGPGITGAAQMFVLYKKYKYRAAGMKEIDIVGALNVISSQENRSEKIVNSLLLFSIFLFAVFCLPFCCLASYIELND